MAAIKKFLLAAAVVLFLETTAVAESNLEFVVNYVLQDGNGGKQVYDGSGNQHLELWEPTLFLDAQITPTMMFTTRLVYDAYTAASDQLFDAATGASGAAAGPGGGGGGGGEGEGEGEGGPPAATPAGQQLVEHRYSADFSLSQKLETWTLAPSAGYSHKFDYNSTHGGLSVAKSFADEDSIVSLAAYYSSDSLEMYDLALKQFTGWTPRLTSLTNASATQILGPMDLVLVGVSLTRQTGLLSSTRNTVAAPTVRVLEVLPGLRDKWTGTLRYIHGLSSQFALHVDYRYYGDSWGIQSHTFEPSLFYGSEDELDLVQVAYRVYTQQGTRYYGDSFAASLPYMTSDSDLASFAAHEIRLLASHRWEIAGTQQMIEVNATAIYYIRTNDLSALILQAGLAWIF